MTTNSFNSSGPGASLCQSLIMVDPSGGVWDYVSGNPSSPSATQLTADGSLATPQTASGTYGTGFRLSKNGTTQTYGWTLGTGINLNAGSGNTTSVFIAVNSLTNGANQTPVFVVATTSSAGAFPTIGFSNSIGSGLQPCIFENGSEKQASGDTLSTATAYSLALVDKFNGARAIYIDGSVAASGTNASIGANSQTINHIGNGSSPTGAMDCYVFCIAIFQGDASSNFLTYHNSLTGSGAFSLITQPTPSILAPWQGAGQMGAIVAQ